MQKVKILIAVFFMSVGCASVQKAGIDYQLNKLKTLASFDLNCPSKNP